MDICQALVQPILYRSGNGREKSAGCCKITEGNLGLLVLCNTQAAAGCCRIVEGNLGLLVFCSTLAAASCCRITKGKKGLLVFCNTQSAVGLLLDMEPKNLMHD